MSAPKVTRFHDRAGRMLYRITCPECDLKYSGTTEDSVTAYHAEHMYRAHDIGNGHPTEADMTPAPQHRKRTF